MKIHNPNNLPLVDYRKVKPLQGNLKELSKENHDKLLKVLTKRGFTAPLFVWQKSDDLYLMDGHQRQKVMIDEDLQPYEVPYLLIEAENIKDAKAQLLEITSQYGTITQQGFDAYLAQAELPQAETVGMVNFDALSFVSIEGYGEDFDLPEGDKEGLEQITFTLAKEQAERVQEAIKRAKATEVNTFGNTNSNGNALYVVCEAYL